MRNIINDKRESFLEVINKTNNIDIVLQYKLKSIFSNETF